MLHIRDFLSHIHRIYDQEYYEQNKMVDKRLSKKWFFGLKDRVRRKKKEKYLIYWAMTLASSWTRNTWLTTFNVLLYFCESQILWDNRVFILKGCYGMHWLLSWLLWPNTWHRVHKGGRVFLNPSMIKFTTVRKICSQY